MHVRMLIYMFLRSSSDAQILFANCFTAASGSVLDAERQSSYNRRQNRKGKEFNIRHPNSQCHGSRCPSRLAFRMQKVAYQLSSSLKAFNFLEWPSILRLSNCFNACSASLLSVNSTTPETMPLSRKTLVYLTDSPNVRAISLSSAQSMSFGRF